MFGLFRKKYLNEADAYRKAAMFEAARYIKDEDDLDALDEHLRNSFNMLKESIHDNEYLDNLDFKYMYCKEIHEQ